MASKDLLLCLHLIITFSITTGETDTIYYDLDDNTLENTFIGNIVNDASLQTEFTSDILATLSYVFLGAGGGDILKYFILEEQTGNLKTSQLLDRDVVCRSQVVCQLELNIAIQPGAYFRSIKVFMSISDLNDNAPRFKDREITIELRESTQPGIIRPLVPATDLDSPANGVKGYRLVDPSNKFQLRVQNSTDYSSLDVSLALVDNLDREVDSTHVLKVIAFDVGTPSRSGTVQLTINVLDVNDNHPQFEQRTYQVEVNESFPLYTQFLQVQATDRDLGANGRVTYSFNPNTVRDAGDTFSLDIHNGSIKLIKQLDFETRSTYSLTVVAQDGGMDSIPSNAKVIVTVLDVNDIAPKIIVNNLPEDGLLHIKENEPNETFVAHLSIHDEEQGDNGKAVCVMEQNDFFALKLLYEKEYKIESTQTIDREVHNQLLLRVICTDQGRPSLRTEIELVVKVDDVNDNFPVFAAGVASAQIEEGNEMDSRVTRIRATDADEGLNGEVKYFCQHEFFDIDAVSGVLTAKKRFDREEQDVYYLNIMATDLGKTPNHNVTLLTVTILDVNDNNPVFVEKSYTMNVSETAQLHTYIGQVEARDIDSNDYNKFYYNLSPSENAQNKFTIDNRTGALYSNYRFDREKTSRYKVEVTVHPDRMSEVQDRATVIIDILDENDNAPIISFPSTESSHIILSNKAPVGYKVTKVIAYDIDLGNNSVLSYQLSEQEEEYFYIDSITGNIYVNKELWPLKDRNFTLKILVSDYGFPQRKTSVETLYVIVNSSVTYIPVNTMANIDSGISIDVIAIVVGCLCGALIAALLVVLCVLLALRRKRKKQQDAIQTWVRSDKVNNSNTFINRHFSGDGQESVDTRRECSPDLPPPPPPPDDTGVTTDTAAPISQRSHTPPVNVPGERDSDSGCFDLSHSDSQSSNEGPQYTVAKTAVNGNRLSNGKPQQPVPTVVQTKCYHPGHTHHQQPTQATTDTYPVPMSTFNPQPPYPAPTLNSDSIPSYNNNSPPVHTLNSDSIPSYNNNSPPIPPIPVSQNNLDFVQPHSQQSQQHSSKPRPPPRFSDYLQTESQQLKQRGHVYRVSNPSNRSLKPSNSVKKTVRFSEPENEVVVGGCDGDRSESPRAVPNEYVSSNDVAKYKSHNGVKYYSSNGNINNNSSSGDDDNRMAEGVMDSNKNIYELADSEALHLNSLV